MMPSLRSQDLVTLISDDGIAGVPRLEHLLLNNTGVEDEAAPFISACSQLRSLEVAGTKFTSTS